MERRFSNRTLYGLLFVLLAIAATSHVGMAIRAARFLRHTVMILPARLDAPWPTVTDVREEAGAALRVGDRVLEVNGITPSGRADISKAMQASQDGSPVQIRLRRGEESLDVTVPAVPRPGPPAWIAWTLSCVVFVLTPIVCLGLGFWVAFARPRDGRAWVLLGLLVSFAQVPGSGFLEVFELPDAIRAPTIIYRAICSNLWPVCMLVFGLYIVRPFKWERRHPWVKWTLIAPSLLAAVLKAAVWWADSENFAAVDRLRVLFRELRMAEIVLSMVCVGLFFFFLHKKYWSPAFGLSNDERRRIRMLVWGSTVSLTPLFLLVLAGIFLGPRVFRNELAVAIIITALLLFPMTMAYVIVVQRAMDIRVVVRQGVQYTLARRGARILQALVSAGVILGAAILAVNPDANRPERIIALVMGLAIVLLIRRIGQKLATWIDRRFFREAYDAEHILTELSEDVRTMVETKPLLETVANRISQSMHVPRIAMLLRDNGAYRPAYAMGYSGSLEVGFPTTAATVHTLAQAREPLRVYLDDERSWLQREGVDEEERRWLQNLDAQLLLPLAAKEKLLGFISLGPKQSEEPYTTGDIRLLKSVATQAGLALENSSLAAAIAREAAHRERLNRELEIAREVQEQLFPRDLPPRDGLDYAGSCRPAQGVGGDYYDFVSLEDGRFGIAIGDVSGKGIPAALLMASLQASLRGQALAKPHDLAALMENVNRQIFDSSQASRYATFFYSEYDPGTRRLTYVNGGHNAPMLVRGDEVIRLDDGGPAVGLFRPAKYVQAAVDLRPGDVIVMFSDGVSEAMNRVDEEWGEENILTVVNANLPLSANEIIPKIFAGADKFADGAPQHDDMTLVVVRIL